MNNEIPIILRSLITFLHPLLMLSALAGTIYTLYLGIQVRRTRNVDAASKKQMLKAKYNQRHFQLSSTLLPAWVFGSVMGMAATYVLYNQLFFSPHLVGGLSFICTASLAAALVPFMRQGNSWARIAHVVLAILLIALSILQLITGLMITRDMTKEILLK